MKQTFKEIIQYISNRSGYVVIGSFAMYCFRPYRYSDDFDIVLTSITTIRLWQKYFCKNGWKVLRDELGDRSKAYPLITFQKQGTTLDLIYGPKTFLLFPKTNVRVYGHTITVITPEASFLRKLSGAFQHPERGKKRLWDLEGALALAGTLNKKKTLHLFKKVYLSKKGIRKLRLRRRSRRK